MSHIAAVDKFYGEFFGNTKAKLRAHPVDGPAKWDAHDRAFSDALSAAKATVRVCLADDFDTPVSAQRSLRRPRSLVDLFPHPLRARNLCHLLKPSALSPPFACRAPWRPSRCSCATPTAT